MAYTFRNVTVHRRKIKSKQTTKMASYAFAVSFLPTSSSLVSVSDDHVIVV